MPNRQPSTIYTYTIRARDSYLPDKGYKYFRAGYKLTVGKWIPPRHVLLFASCGQCSQDSVKESPLFPPPTIRTRGAHPGRHRSLCRGRRHTGRRSDGEMPKVLCLLSLPSSPQSAFAPFLHSRSVGNRLGCKMFSMYKSHVEKSIQRTSILKKTCIRSQKKMWK